MLVSKELKPEFLSAVQTGDPSSVAGGTSEAAPEAHLVIWGTDVNIQETKRKFREFLETFIDDLPSNGGYSPVAGDRVEPYYMQRLDEVSPLSPWRPHGNHGIYR